MAEMTDAGTSCERKNTCKEGCAGISIAHTAENTKPGLMFVRRGEAGERRCDVRLEPCKAALTKTLKVSPYAILSN
jgi:hypothetical protein